MGEEAGPSVAARWGGASSSADRHGVAVGEQYLKRWMAIEKKKRIGRDLTTKDTKGENKQKGEKKEMKRRE